MALNPRELLTKNAEAFAAGKVLGMSEDEVLMRLQSLSEQKKTTNSNALNAAFLDEAIEGRYKSFDAPISGRDLLREAKRTLNAASKVGPRPKTREKASPEARARAMEAVLFSLEDKSQQFAEDIRQRPKTFFRDNDDRRALLNAQKNVNANAPELFGVAENDDSTASADFRDDVAMDPTQSAADGTGFDPAKSGIATDKDYRTYDENGYVIEDSFGITGEEAAAARANRFGDQVFGADTPIPMELRYERDENGEFMLDDRGQLIPTREYSKYVDRSWGQLGRSRIAPPQVQDPNFAENITFRSRRDSKSIGRDPFQAAASLERRERMIQSEFQAMLDAEGVPANAGELYEKYRAQRLFEMGDYSPVIESSRTVVRDAEGNPILNEDGLATFTDEPVDRLVRRRYGWSDAEGQNYDDEIVQRDVVKDLPYRSPGNGRALLAADRAQAQATIAANPGFVVLPDQSADVADIQSRAFIGEESSPITGLTSIKGAKGLTGDGVAFERDTRPELTSGVSDPTVLREMESDAVRLEREARVIDTAQALAEVRQGRGFFNNTAEDEVALVSTALNVSPEEARTRIREVKQEAQMGLTAREMLSQMSTPSIRTGEFPQVDISQSLGRVLEEGNKKLRAAKMPEMPFIRSVEDVELLAEKVLEAGEITKRGGKPGIAGAANQRLLGTSASNVSFPAGPSDEMGQTGRRGGFNEFLNMVLPDANERTAALRALQQLDFATRDQESGAAPVNSGRKDSFQRGGVYFEPQEVVDDSRGRDFTIVKRGDREYGIEYPTRQLEVQERGPEVRFT